MQISTKYFGEVTCEPEEIVRFPNGLFGFEEEREFVLLPFEGTQGSLLCFQSLATPSLAFVAMDPFALDPAYHPQLTAEELALMGAGSVEELCYYVFCVVREPVGESTVNLRCPIVIAPHSNQAMQVILDTREYQMRHRLAEFQAKEAEGTC